MIEERVRKWVENRGILVREQAGFRRNFGTVDNGVVLNFLVKRELKKGNKLYACFVDFQRAFDTVNRDLLWIKLRKIGMPEKFVSVLMSLYQRVDKKVRVSGNGNAVSVLWLSKS